MKKKNKKKKKKTEKNPNRAMMITQVTKNVNYEVWKKLRSIQRNIWGSKNKKREYGENGYQNMSEGNKQKNLKKNTEKSISKYV